MWIEEWGEVNLAVHISISLRIFLKKLNVATKNKQACMKRLIGVGGGEAGL